MFLNRPCLFLLLALLLIGCSNSNRDSNLLIRQQAATIQSLNEETLRLNQELEQVLDDRKILFRAMEGLEKDFSGEVARGDVSLRMEERGLVVSVLDRVLFDSGKIKIKPSARGALSKLGDSFRGELAGYKIYVEGHTDNEPIRHSGWKSNWELSTSRATEVIHYFAQQEIIASERFAACGFSEFRPLESNDTLEGRQRNRRVEIVISPQKVDPDEVTPA